MNVAYIRAEVEKRIAEQLPAFLFEKGLAIHAKRSFRLGCTCDYCLLKVEATRVIGEGKTITGFNSNNCDIDDYYDARKEHVKSVRQMRRKIYRQKLKELMRGAIYESV